MSFKKIFFIFLIIYYLFTKAYAKNAHQVLSAGLPQIMHISKIIVENVEYPRNSTLSNMIIKSITPVNPNLNILGLTPLQVEVETNSSTPLILSATFQELKNNTLGYNFPSSDLFISPESYTISNPSHIFITDYFTPYVYVRPAAVAGTYRGKLLFTLGGL